MRWPSCDVAVVGAGIVGLAVAEAAARRGAAVACFEASEPGAGQTAGLTRIFRHVHADPSLVPLAREALVGWRALERHSGRVLVGGEGVLLAGPDVDARADGLAAAGVAHRVLDPDDVRAAHPLLAPGLGRALLDPGAGAIRARRAVEVYASLLGPRLVPAEVLTLRRDGAGVTLRTPEGLWRAGCTVICAGARTSELAGRAGLDVPVELSCHVRATFRLRDPSLAGRVPCLIDRSGAFGAQVYAVPVGTRPEHVIGLSGERPDEPLDGADAPAVEAALERLSAYAAQALPGLDPDPVGVRLCLASELPVGGDAFDTWGEPPVLVLAGANLFKLAPLLGERLAAAALEAADPVATMPV